MACTLCPGANLSSAPLPQHCLAFLATPLPPRLPTPLLLLTPKLRRLRVPLLPRTRQLRLPLLSRTRQLRLHLRHIPLPSLLSLRALPRRSRPHALSLIRLKPLLELLTRLLLR